MAAYGTDQGLIDYLERTGRETDRDPAHVREMGSLWVDSFCFKSSREDPDQERKFPRKKYGMPQAVEYAAYEAGYAWAEGDDIWGSQNFRPVVREKVDVLEVQYAEPQATDLVSYARMMMPIAYAYLEPYLCAPRGGGGLFVAKRHRNDLC